MTRIVNDQTDDSSNARPLSEANLLPSQMTPLALAQAFEHYRPRLRRMVKLRMDRRLQGRVDPTDVLQEAYLDLARRCPKAGKSKDEPGEGEGATDREMPIFLWLRFITGQKLLEFHRRHLGVQARDARREVTP